MSVLGQGTQGCALWPALVLPGSTKVNEDNRRQYISKLATDASEEYHVATEIRKRLANQNWLNVGVFPLELTCGVSQTDLGANVREIVGKCQQSFQFQLKQYLLYEPEALCVEVFPRYTQDLATFYEKLIKPWNSPDRDTFVQTLLTSLTAKLTKLHAVNAYHLDISKGNIALFGSPNDPIEKWSIRFNAATIQQADFGLAELLDTPERIIKVGHQMFHGEFWDVFVYRSPKMPLMKFNATLFKSLYMDNARRPEVVKELLSLFDEVSLVGAFHKLWLSDDRRMQWIVILNNKLAELDQKQGTLKL